LIMWRYPRCLPDIRTEPVTICNFSKFVAALDAARTFDARPSW
jgi:hypothetical protein